MACLKGSLSLEQLVDWAENCFLEPEFGPDEDIDLLTDVVMYLAGADTKGFPLTWNIIHEFLDQLGTPVRVIPA